MLAFLLMMMSTYLRYNVLALVYQMCVNYRMSFSDTLLNMCGCALLLWNFSGYWLANLLLNHFANLLKLSLHLQSK